MLPVSARHSKIRRKAFCFLLCCSLIFPVISVAGSVPAAALTYELGNPELWEWDNEQGEPYERYSYSVWSYDRSRSLVVPFSLSSVFSELGITNMPGRESVVDNISSFGVTDISGNGRTSWSFTYLVDDSGYTEDDGITFWDFGIKSKSNILSNGYVLLSGLHFIYPAISLPPRSQSNKIFRLNYSFDFYLNTSNADWSYLESTFNDIIVPSLVCYPGQMSGDPFIAPASSVVVERTAGRSFNITAYFDFTFGQLYDLLGSDYTYSTMRPVITVPNLLPFTNAEQTARIRARSLFPTSYDLISGGEYAAELESINSQLADITTAINDQNTVIISGVQDALEDTLINNRDPENDEKISEMESKEVEVSEVMSDYDRYHARIKQAAQSELSVPDYLGLDPEGGFADMIGQIVSLPLFLGIIPVGLFFGLLKILFGTGG